MSDPFVTSLDSSRRLTAATARRIYELLVASADLQYRAGMYEGSWDARKMRRGKRAHIAAGRFQRRAFGLLMDSLPPSELRRFHALTRKAHKHD